MSQAWVERVIGLLATDEGLRRRFRKNPRSALMEMELMGMELTDCERWSLTRIDPDDVARFADAIDDRLQKATLEGNDA